MRRLLLMVAILVVACLVSLQAKAQTPSLVVDIFAPRDGVMVGEPVVVTVRFTNRSEGILTVGPPWSGRGTVEFREATNRRSSVVESSGVIEDAQYRGIGASGTRLKPRQSFSEKHVLDLWPGFILPAKAGRYLLAVRLSVPFATRGRGEDRSYTCSTVVGMPVYVKVAHAEELRAKADELRQEIVSREGKVALGRNDVELDTLFSMPEEVAGPVWRNLVEDLKPSLPAPYALRLHLCRIGTRLAADLLAELWGEETSPMRDLKARDQLVSLYHSGSKDMREYVGKIFLAREGKLPPPISLNVEADGGTRIGP